MVIFVGDYYLHRRLEAELVPLDTEIERTLRNLEKKKEIEKANMAEQRNENQNIHIVAVEGTQQRQRMMEDLWRPVIKEEYSADRQPPIEANNFELKPVLITMVQQNQFIGHPSEDPNEHLGKFLRTKNTVKMNGVNPNVIKLQLFPFSLRDTTASWFESLSSGLVRNWEELVEAYLNRFFPPILTSERRGEIISFKQREDEPLFNA